MINVLFIAYYFPPIGGAGVQRSLKFVRCLPEQGFLPIVVTGPGVSNSRWTPLDGPLLKEVPPDIPVYRIHNDAPLPRRGLSARFERWFGAPGQFSRWWTDSVIELGGKVCVEKDIKLIYVSMSPFDSANAAAHLSSKLGIPWVADLRDPWALDEMQTYPTFLHRRAQLSKMHASLSSASTIIMNTPEASTLLKKRFSDFRHKTIATITNGFDSQDFEGRVTPPRDNRFRIIHSGYLHTDLGFSLKRQRRFNRIIGGIDAGVDVLTRSHVVLIQAIERWLVSDPEIADDLEIVFAGSTTEADKQFAGNSAASKLIRFTGYLSHAESINIVRTADLLFLPMHNLPPERRATIVPGKTYEYMASGRPILAAVPDGDARDWLQQCGTAFICRPDDVEGMLTIIRTAYDTWERGEQTPTPNRDFLRQFDRRHLTKRLAAVFEEVLRTK